MVEINKVSIVMEEFRDAFHEAQEEKPGGPTLEELSRIVRTHTEDSVVNTAVCMWELRDGLNFYMSKNDCLTDAISLLDHLHTLGMEVRFKT